MHTIAFVGASGTGKSHRAAMVARKNGADAIIDDGLLISGNRVIAGTSAKKAPTRLASVRHALFIDKEEARVVSRAILENKLNCVMILGTSDGMVHRIAQALDLPPVERIVRIEDFATPEEITAAQNMRQVEGKHVIPVPEFEIKKDFSGYFMHPMRLFRKSLGDSGDLDEDKTIVRPTFSYLGEYTISDNVIISIARYEAMKNRAVFRINSVNVRSTSHGAHLDVSLSLSYGVNIPKVCQSVQQQIRYGVEQITSVNVRRVHIYVKSLHIAE